MTTTTTRTNSSVWKTSHSTSPVTKSIYTWCTPSFSMFRNIPTFSRQSFSTFQFPIFQLYHLSFDIYQSVNVKCPINVFCCCCSNLMSNEIKWHWLTKQTSFSVLLCYYIWFVIITIQKGDAIYCGVNFNQCWIDIFDNEWTMCKWFNWGEW